MTKRNKFGIEPTFSAHIKVPPATRDRKPGPMGTAVRETADSLQETTEAKVEQRRRNAEDAKQYRAAQEDGLVLERLPVGNIRTDDLPRDRIELEAVAQSDAMEELKTSIRERGQKEPIEVFLDEAGNHQLKKGWRRLTALRQLFEETSDDQFATVVARVEAGEGDRMTRYIDMVEENVVREDLTFAEMAQVAITAAADPTVPEDDAGVLVNRLYQSLHKVKRSYIRSFVTLMQELGDALKFPKSVSRNMGVDVARALAGQGGTEELARELSSAETEEDQASILVAFLERAKKGKTAPVAKTPAPKKKFEFFVGKTKVTARKGECRIVSDADFASLGSDRLARAVKAFEDALKG